MSDEILRERARKLAEKERARCAIAMHEISEYIKRSPPIVACGPDLSTGPGAGMTDEYYRHLHRSDPFDRRMMDRVIPDRIIRDNMGLIKRMR